MKKIIAVKKQVSPQKSANVVIRKQQWDGEGENAAPGPQMSSGEILAGQGAGGRGGLFRLLPGLASHSGPR